MSDRGAYTLLRTLPPYYDVVLSRGGVFVTEGEGVTPASAARVERLLKSMDNDIALLVQRMHKTLLKAAINDKKELFLVGCRIDKYMRDYTRNLLCRNVDGVTTNTLYYLENYDSLLNYEAHLTQTYLGEGVRENLIRWANTPSSELTFTTQGALSSLQRVTAELFLEEVVNPEPDKRTMQRLENLLCDTLRRTAEIVEYDKTVDVARLFVCRAPHQGNNFFV